MINLQNLASNANLIGGSKKLDVFGGYTEQISTLGNLSPADATTYYIGNSLSGATLSATSARTYVAKKGILKKIFLTLRASTLGSGEQSTIKLVVNGTTEYTITTTAVCNATSNAIINTSLSIPLNEGDYFCFKWDTPTWVTNPVIIFNGLLWIEPIGISVFTGSKYVLQTISIGLSPSALTNYLLADGTQTTSGGSARTYIPYSGNITSAFLNIRCSTNSSAETFTYSIKVNNGTEYNITTTATLNATNNDFNNTGLSIPVVAGDYIELKMACPPWITAPTGVSNRFVLVVTI